MNENKRKNVYKLGVNKSLYNTPNRFYFKNIINLRIIIFRIRDSFIIRFSYFYSIESDLIKYFPAVMQVNWWLSWIGIRSTSIYRSCGFFLSSATGGSSAIRNIQFFYSPFLVRHLFSNKCKFESAVFISLSMVCGRTGVHAFPRGRARFEAVRLVR